MSQFVDEDPLLDRIGSASLAYSSLFPGPAPLSGDEESNSMYSLPGHYPTLTEMGRFQDEFAAREGRIPSAAESSQHRICLATTRAQAAREEINAQRRAAAATAAPA